MPDDASTLLESNHREWFSAPAMPPCAEAAEDIQAQALESKEGYSFWLGPRANTSRILRASRNTASSVTKLKLAVTDRLTDLASQTQVEFSFSGDREKLLAYAAEEIRLYRLRIEPKA